VARRCLGGEKARSDSTDGPEIEVSQMRKSPL
jgi:hypothetical protein